MGPGSKLLSGVLSWAALKVTKQHKQSEVRVRYTVHNSAQCTEHNKKWLLYYMTTWNRKWGLNNEMLEPVLNLRAWDQIFAPQNLNEHF